ncbi:MAG: preprotein translocase subunit TatC [Rhizobiales bacterium]|nr:preprotein translocase subunit TatC [Hyphomicrobiales bacterium]
MTLPSGPYHHASKTGLSAAVIDELVAAFYAKMRQDALLGPVFADILGEDWDAHLEKVAAFWRYTTRLDRTYHARDFMPAHMKHPQIQASLLPRWLLLFRQTARDVCRKEAADQLIDIAERMAESIAMSLARRGAPAEPS